MHMKLTIDQTFLLDKLVAEDFQEMENYFWDDSGVKEGSWIDLLEGEFGAQWMRYAVLNGGPKTMNFLNEYGWSSTTSVHSTNQNKTPNLTLAAVVLLEGDKKRIQQLYECGWLKGNEKVTQTSYLNAHDFAILNSSADVASWLIDYQSQHSKEKRTFIEKIKSMNQTANNLYLYQTLKLDEPMGERYKIYLEHMISTYTQTSAQNILPEFLKIVQADEPSEMLFNEVFLTVLLSAPNAYDQSMQTIWNNILDANPALWFTLAKEFPMEQIERQKVQMLKHRKTEGSFDIIQKWIKFTKLNNPQLFGQLCDVAQKLSDFKTKRKYSASEIEQALEHTHLLLEVEQKNPHAKSSSQRKL